MDVSAVIQIAGLILGLTGGAVVLSAEQGQRRGIPRRVLIAGMALMAVSLVGSLVGLAF